MCEALTYLFDNIFIRFGIKLYRQIVCIPMGTYCARLIADLFYFAMKEILWALFSNTKQLRLFKHFTLHLDN